MGAAIPVMHYTGMAAASFTASGLPTDLSHAVSISTLGTRRNCRRHFHSPRAGSADVLGR